MAIFIIPAWLILSVTAALLTGGGIAAARGQRKRHAMAVSDATQRILAEHENDCDQAIAATLTKAEHRRKAIPSAERSGDKTTVGALEQEVDLLDDALAVLRAFRDSHEVVELPKEQ